MTLGLPLSLQKQGEAGVASHPERLRAVDTDLVQRNQALVDGVQVDLDETLSNDDE